MSIKRVLMYSFGGAFSKEEKKSETVSAAWGWAWAEQHNFKEGRMDCYYSPLTVLQHSQPTHSGLKFMKCQMVYLITEYHTGIWENACIQHHVLCSANIISG